MLDSARRYPLQKAMARSDPPAHEVCSFAKASASQDGVTGKCRVTSDKKKLKTEKLKRGHRQRSTITDYLAAGNWQSGEVGESGAFSGLIGAGTGAVGSITPMRLFTQCV